MASQGCRRCPQHCPHCPLRRHCHHCPLHAINFIKPQFAPLPLKTLPLHNRQQPIPSHVPISQELEHIEPDGEEEDDDPVFVLTDEWREFFAQSEARRKLEKKKKKQGKKGNK